MSKKEYTCYQKVSGVLHTSVVLRQSFILRTNLYGRVLLNKIIYTQFIITILTVFFSKPPKIYQKLSYLFRTLGFKTLSDEIPYLELPFPCGLV